VIAYVTCSPVNAETTDIIAQALIDHANLVALDTPAVLEQCVGTEVPGARRGSAVQLWTHRHQTDSMFIQLLTTTKTG
jgi:16S rRNA (cytosine967-C5)-methyltransferase